MAGSVTLKAQNLKSIWVIVAIDIILIFIVFGLALLNLSTVQDLSKILIPLTTVLSASAVGCILIKFMSDLLSSNLKAVLVFWRIHHVLPGCRAFSEIAARDPRIDIAALRKRIGEFPINSSDQNKLWYRIYQVHKEDKTVREAHQKYLLFRDCTSLTILIGIIALIVCFFTGANLKQYLILIFIISIQFLFSSICARNNGIRFVQNVLALESVSSHKIIKFMTP